MAACFHTILCSLMVLRQHHLTLAMVCFQVYCNIWPSLSAKFTDVSRRLLQRLPMEHSGYTHAVDMSDHFGPSIR